MLNINLTCRNILPSFRNDAVNRKRDAEEIGGSTMTSEITERGLIVPNVSVQQRLAKEEVIMKCLMRM